MSEEKTAAQRLAEGMAIHARYDPHVSIGHLGDRVLAGTLEVSDEDASTLTTLGWVRSLPEECWLRFV